MKKLISALFVFLYLNPWSVQAQFKPAQKLFDGDFYKNHRETEPYNYPVLTQFGSDSLPDLRTNSGVYPQLSNGTFARQGYSYKGEVVVEGDWNQDGWLDLLVTPRSHDRKLILYIGQSSGLTPVDSFLAQSGNFGYSYSSRPWAQFIDYDGDGDQDFVYKAIYGSGIFNIHETENGRLSHTATRLNFAGADMVQFVQVYPGGAPEVLELTPRTDSLGNDILRIWERNPSGYAITYQHEADFSLGVRYYRALEAFVVDLDNNQRMDLAFKFSAYRNFYFLQDSSRGFRPVPTDYRTIPQALSDLNEDGKPELLAFQVGFPAYKNRNDTLAIVGYANGQITHRRVAGPLQHDNIFINDLDGDGHQDVSFFDGYMGNLFYLAGYGNETFDTLRVYQRIAMWAIPSNTTRWGRSSYQNNTYDSVAVSPAGKPFKLQLTGLDIMALPTDGAPGFVLPEPLAPASGRYKSYVRARNMNRDGKPDAVVVAANGEIYWTEVKPDAVPVQLASPKVNDRYPITWNYPDACEFQDVNQDGLADYIGFLPQETNKNPRAVDTIFTRFLQPNGTLGPPQILLSNLASLPGSPDLHLMGDWMQDVDRDGYVDILLSRYDSGGRGLTEFTYFWCKGGPGARFSAPKYSGRSFIIQDWPSEHSNLEPVQLWYRDFDGDHIPDYIAIDSTPSLVFHKGDSSGNFSSRTLIARLPVAWPNPFGMSWRDGTYVEDFNRDGFPDCLIHRTTNYSLYLSDELGILHQSDGDFAGGGAWIHDWFWLRLSDLNRDGYMDFTAVQEEGVYGVLNVIPKTTRITGKVFATTADSCSADPATRLGLPGWLAKAEPSGAFCMTDSTGMYALFVDSVAQTIRFQPHSLQRPALQFMCNQGVVQVPPLSPGTRVTLHQGALMQFCHFLTVSPANTRLGYCRENLYSVQYANQGTQAADSVKVRMEIPAPLQLVRANVPFVQLGPGLFQFSLGRVPNLTTRQFNLTIYVPCTDSLLGKAACFSATISPFSDCVPDTAGPTAFDGSDPVLSHECQGGRLVFGVKNEGASMRDSIPWVAFRQDGIRRDGKLRLAAGSSTQIGPMPGTTLPWYLVVRRPVASPYGVFSTQAANSCNQIMPNADFINSLPPSDGRHSASVCVPIVAAIDPNDKRSNPAGMGADHLTDPDGKLTYVIHFENLGSGHAQTVVIRDTLSGLLDPSTILQGSSSHPFQLSVRSEEVSLPGQPRRIVLNFISQGINLPYRDLDSIGANGYISFSIRPKPGLPDGTRLENRAGIYFDQNTVVLTNTTWVTLSDSIWLPTSVDPIPVQPIHSALQLQPNPATGMVTIYGRASGVADIYSALGAQVGRVQLNASGSATVSIGYLKPGLYLVRCGGETERLIVE